MYVISEQPSVKVLRHETHGLIDWDAHRVQFLGGMDIGFCEDSHESAVFAWTSIPTNRIPSILFVSEECLEFGGIPSTGNEYGYLLRTHPTVFALFHSS